MNGPAGALLVLALLLAAGGGLARALGLFTARTSRPSRLALAFVTGWLAATTGLFLLALCGVRLGVGAAVAVLGPCLIGWLRRAPAPAPRPALGFVGGAGVAVLLLVAARAAVVCCAEPVTVGDAWLNWQLKARAFYEDRTLAVLGVEPAQVGHRDYPLHVPLSSTLFHLLMGRPDDLLAKLAHLAGYLSILALVAGALPGAAGPWAAALLGATPAVVQSVPVALADLPFALMVLGAGLALAGDEPADLRQAGLFLYGGLWTKNEGATLALAGVALAALRAPRTGRARDLAGLAPVVLFVPWIAYRVSLGLRTEELVNAGFQPRRLPDVGAALAAEALKPEWLLLWPALVLLVAVRPRPGAAGALLLAQLGAYVLVYLVAGTDHLWLLQTTRSRLLLHLAPLATVLAWRIAIGAFSKGSGPPGS